MDEWKDKQMDRHANRQIDKQMNTKDIGVNVLSVN